MIFREDNLVYTVQCKGSEIDFRGDLQFGWVEYDDMDRDHEAIETAVAMIQAANTVKSFTKLKAVEIDYDTCILRVTAQPVMDERTAMYTLVDQFDSLEIYERTQATYQDQGSKYDVRVAKTMIRRLQAHLGRDVTREEAVAYVERDQIEEKEEDLAALGATL